MLETETPARPARRSQSERRDESERALVEATLKVVAEQGVGAATFEEIGRAAGLSRGLVTQRFGSKRGLTEAVIAYLHRRREAALEADHADEKPALDVLERYMTSHLRAMETEMGGRAYFMLLAAAVADAAAPRELFAKSHERVRVWLRAVIERGQAQGALRTDLDADAAALMVGSLLLGLSMQRLIDPDTDIEKIRTTAIEVLERALLPRQGA